MLRWLANWASHHAPTPEKQAERALTDLRMELFRAEQNVLDAQLRVDYYRARLTFLEQVASKGIERVSDERKAVQQSTPNSMTGLKLTAAK